MVDGTQRAHYLERVAIRPGQIHRAARLIVAAPQSATRTVKTQGLAGRQRMRTTQEQGTEKVHALVGGLPERVQGRCARPRVA